METPRRILIIKLGSIGDVVHTVPALADLKQSFPEAEIDWLVESKARVILNGNPWLNEVVEIDTHKWRRSWSLATLAEMRRIAGKLRRRRYEVAFDFQGLWKSAVLGRVSGARKLIGFDRTTLKEPGCRMFYDEQIKPAAAVHHVIDIYKELPRSLGVTPGPHRFHLSVSSQDEQYISQQLSSRQMDDFVILNPGGGWDTKNWAPENYALLHDKLRQETGLHSVLTWGPGEEPLVDRVLRACVGTPPCHFSCLAASTHRTAQAGQALRWRRHRAATSGSRLWNADCRRLRTYRPSTKRTVLSRGHCGLASGSLWAVLQAHVPNL